MLWQAATVAVADDEIAFVDANDSDFTKTDTIVSLASEMAGLGTIRIRRTNLNHCQPVTSC